jgi:uncharacterized linocin/CFP29 family protein
VNGGIDQVGWTDAQWNRVREGVMQAWQRVRVAGSFLPVYGPLPASTQVVPSEVLTPAGTVDDQATTSLLEIALPVSLSRQQVREDDLSSALLQFRRRAAQVGQLEDWYIFNGTYPSGGFDAARDEAVRTDDRVRYPGGHQPAISFLENVPAGFPVLTGTPNPIADARTQVEGLRRRNPGALGLIEGSAELDDATSGTTTSETSRPRPGDELVKGVVDGVSTLEENGFVAPYVCVFGRDPFLTAHTYIEGSTSAPRDRLEPLIGSTLLHASAIDVPARTSAGHREEWRKRGVLLSLADDAVDLVIAAAATPEFRRVDERGRFEFVVFERFALRIKDPTAIVRLNLGA